MKRKVELEEAKRVLKNDRIFLGYNDKLLVPSFGQYRPNMTYVIPNQWIQTSEELVDNPIHWQKCDELVDNMNIDFESNERTVLFGNYSISKNGKPMFEVTDPKDASKLLIRSS